jgi:hypothetical protein
VPAGGVAVTFPSRDSTAGTGVPGGGSPPRHPYDPDPVRASKAVAVLALGVIALVTGPLVGGAVPATVALVLAGQARREARASGGFLTGAALVRRGERLAWAGLLLAAAAIAAAVAIGLFRLAATPAGQDYPPTID